MAQNPEPGQCDGDRYCDANNVCGVRCVELDLMEANRHAFHAELHGAWANSGERGGLGGGAWGLPTDGSYGPSDAAQIDTRRPFRVHSHFEVESGGDGVGQLSAVVTTLTQGEEEVRKRADPQRSSLS